MSDGFARTGLRDAPLVRQAYELSYAAFEEKFMDRHRGISKAKMGRLLDHAGVSLADTHDRLVLRMPRLLEASGCVSDEAIAAALLYKTAKENPDIMRGIDGKAAGYIARFLEWDRQVIAALRALDAGEDLENLLSREFAGSVSGAREMSAENNALMKIWAVAGMEAMQNLAGMGAFDPRGFGAKIAYAKIVAKQVGSMPASPVDELFERTLVNADHVLAAHRAGGPAAAIG